MTRETALLQARIMNRWTDERRNDLMLEKDAGCDAEKTADALMEAGAPSIDAMLIAGRFELFCIAIAQQGGSAGEQATALAYIRHCSLNGSEEWAMEHDDHGRFAEALAWAMFMDLPSPRDMRQLPRGAVLKAFAVILDGCGRRPSDLARAGSLDEFRKRSVNGEGCSALCYLAWRLSRLMDAGAVRLEIEEEMKHGFGMERNSAAAGLVGRWYNMRIRDCMEDGPLCTLGSASLRRETGAALSSGFDPGTLMRTQWLREYCQGRSRDSVSAAGYIGWAAGHRQPEPESQPDMADADAMMNAAVEALRSLSETGILLAFGEKPGKTANRRWIHDCCAKGDRFAWMLADPLMAARYAAIVAREGIVAASLRGFISWCEEGPEETGEPAPQPEPGPVPEPEPMPRPEPESKPMPGQEAKPSPKPGAEAPDGYGALVGAIAAQVTESLREQARSDLKDFAADFMRDTYGIVPQRIVVEQPGREPKRMDGLFHKEFPGIVKLIGQKVPVYLEGEAGTGKNVICRQAADALGLKMYYSGAVQQEYGIRGFTDANGIYRESEFYKAFTQGGLFMLDEMDASSPDVLVLLNGAIANGWFDFPAPVGRLDAHDDFRVVGAGNTSASGANELYTGRQKLDAATLDRFVFIRIGYDEGIENAMAKGNEELAGFARDLRDIARRNGISTVVSYRGIGGFLKCMGILGPAAAIRSCFLKGLSSADAMSLAGGITSKKYRKWLTEAVGAMAREEA